MNKPTKIQTTVDFDKIPIYSYAQIQKLALPALKAAVSELEHLLSQHPEGNVEAATLLFHLDQTRRRMFSADLYLQDIQNTVTSYREYLDNEHSQNQIPTPQPQRSPGPAATAEMLKEALHATQSAQEVTTKTHSKGVKKKGVKKDEESQQ